ncbi:MAG: D-glycero-alpha-D-manno-heptose-1,7-bisphosphate 7-phosphatase [Nitrososphaerales archaeon]
MTDGSGLDGRTDPAPPTSLLRPSFQLQEPARAGILLDRDGTIIVDYGYVGSPDQVELIDGAAEAIGRFNDEGLPVVVVTNQGGVAHGYYGIDDVRRVHDRLSIELGRQGAHIDMFVFCPYHPYGVVDPFARHSEDRKPRPGMAIAAARALHLDLTTSWVIGDRPEDVGLAQTIGAAAVHIGPSLPTGLPSFLTLAEAADFVLQRIAA